jgi:hypothetical protein
MVVGLNHGEFFPAFARAHNQPVLGMDFGFLYGSRLDLGHEFGVIPNLAFFVGTLGLLNEKHESHKNEEKEGNGFKVLVQ